MKIVLFLGAGFSRHFDLPVMNEFFSFARDSERLNNDDQELLTRLRKQAREANALVETSPTNLEDVLSLAVLSERVGAQQKGEADRLRHVLRKVYTSSDHLEWKQLQTLLESFLGFRPVDRSHEVNIVTTNYDILAESALGSLGCPPNIGFQWKSADSPPVHKVSSIYSAKDAEIHLFKLHGSVNWYPNSEDPETLIVDDRIVAVHKPGGNNGSWPCVLLSKYQPPSAPVVVPPSFLKPELVKPLQRVWAGAAEAIQSARKVIFVGYSFPDSDVEMRYFLAWALGTNMELDEIRIIDPNADAIAARLRSDQSRYGSHFKEFLRTDASPWASTKLGLE